MAYDPGDLSFVASCDALQGSDRQTEEWEGHWGVRVQRSDRRKWQKCIFRDIPVPLVSRKSSEHPEMIRWQDHTGVDSHVCFPVLIFFTMWKTDTLRTTSNTHTNGSSKGWGCYCEEKKQNRICPHGCSEKNSLPCRTHYNGPSLMGARMGPVEVLSDTGKGKQVWNRVNSVKPS